MTQYLEFDFKIEPVEPWNEILMAELIEQGFDSFTENPDGILAYIQAELLNEEELKNQWLLNHDEVKFLIPIRKCLTSTGMKNGRKTSNRLM